MNNSFRNVLIFSLVGSSCVPTLAQIGKEREQGNDTADSASFSDTGDSASGVDVPPTVIATASPDPAGNDGTVTLDAYVTDDEGIAFVIAALGSSSQEMTSLGDALYSSSYSTGTLPLGENEYTITAFDTAGQKTSVAGAFTVQDVIPPVFSNVYADPSSVVNDGTEAFIIYACVEDETDGTEIGGGVQVTLDTLAETLYYDSPSSCYKSLEINGDVFSAGSYIITAAATDTGGNTATDSSASVEITEPAICPYSCSSNVCLYVDGSLEAEVKTEYPEQMTAIDTLRVGYGNQQVDTLILNVDGAEYVHEDFSADVGCFTTGTVDSGVYISEGTDNDCFFSPSFDATTSLWMTSLDVLPGSTPNFAFRSSFYSSTPVGVNWDYQNNGYINDGAGNIVSFTSGMPDTSATHTITMCNKNTE